ncbi:microtubule-associated protein 10 [Microcaecilia unicolor]|uniref:Microtubule-associated protein 10 n=1 Tax=Microcaecilia unicolor TaxID=1415580 RepID=A0A6P7XEL8_9AMPH|nr:microtubule-associated protein 10 [Microcaecilia unicolor]
MGDLMEKEETADVEGGESLFCLELLVEYVCINHELQQSVRPSYADDEKKSSVPQLCIAFRLLDFPTLLVYPPESPHVVKSPRTPLLRVHFGRGKSCVFRMGARTLRAHLSRAPLYAMLLQLGVGNLPRLLASAPLSLASVSEHRGAHALCNLMGREVGRLALAYRLLCLGASLLPHLPPSSSLELVSGEERASTSVAAVEGDNVVPILQPLLLEKPEEPQLLVVSETEAAPSPCKKASVSTQTRPNLLKPCNSSARGSVTDQEIEANVLCPPPLFYCSATSEPKKELPVQYKYVNKEKPVLMEEPVLEEEFLFWKSSTARTEHHKSRSQQPHPTPPDQRRNISQLPLLNALLVELSLLSSHPIADHTAVHPQLAWLYRSVSNEDSISRVSQLRSKLQTETDKLELTEKNKKSNSPKHKIADVLKLATPLSQNVQKGAKKITEPEKNSETKDHGCSTKKLFYGLTNTLKLRLQQKNPDMLIVHERREQYRKKQQEMLKLKKRRNRGFLPTEKRFKHSLTHIQSYRSENGRISYPNRSFDENIETLIQNSVNKENYQNKNEIKSLPQEHNTGHGLNDHVENVVSNNPQEDNANLSSLEKPQVDPEHCRENERNGKVLRPQPAPQDCDVGDAIASENISTMNGNANTSGKFASFRSVGCKENPKNSLPSSPDEIYSEDFIASQEGSRDSHDVTSPDHTEPLDSFPNTVVVSPEEDPSGSDSGSSMQVNSGESARTSSISAPLPVPSTASPIQSSNRTRRLKDKHQGLSAALIVSNENVPSGEQKEQEDKTRQCNISTHEVNNIQGSPVPDIKCEDGDRESDKSLSVRTSQVSSYLPSNLSDLDLSALGSIESDHITEGQAQSGLSTLDISNQYKHITELVINHLPGYTL